MYEVDGKNYGVPFDLGLVGFWYNTESFTGPASRPHRPPGPSS
jgi:spermidine/putrescine-binding protein